MIKTFFRIIAFLMLFTLAFSLLLTTISATETGSKWFINWLIKTNDIPLTIETIEGRLIDTLFLHGLHYNNEEGNEIMLGKLVIDWSPSALSSTKVHVNRIDIEDVTYRSTGDDSDEKIELPELTFPSILFAISVDELNIKNTRVLINDVEQNIQHINSSLTMNKARLSFQLQELISEQQHFSGHVDLVNNKLTELDALINWKGELQQEAGQATFKIKGQQNNLAVALDINSVLQAKVNGSVNFKDQPYHAELNGKLSGELFEAYSEEFTLDAPIVFDLIGDLNQVSGEFNTHAKLASGDAFAFKLETNAVIPGEKYDTLNVNVNWQTLPDMVENFFLSLKGQADFEYADQILLFDHDFEFPAAVNMKGNANFATDSVELSMQWDELAIPLSDEDLFIFNSGLLNAKGKLDAIAVSLEADYLISVKGNVDKILYNNISAEGIADLLSEHPVVELNGTLKTALPESIKDYIESVGIIDFVVISEEDSLKIKANSDFQSEQLGPIKLGLVARWADSILTLDSLDLDVLDGKIKASGALNVQDKTNGTFELKGHHLNIGVIDPDLFSQLDLDANVILSETAKGLSTEIEMTSLSGKWRGFPLTGSAQFAYTDDVYRIEKLNLNSGNNSIDINLNMDELLSGLVELSIQDLSLFSSELGGEIKGRMKIGGNIDTPNVEGKLTGKDIYVNDIRLAAISADSNIDLRSQQHSTMKLQLTTLSYQNYAFNEVLINGQGLTESHKIDITASGPELNVNAVVDAGLNNKLWSGKFMQLDVTNKDVGLWQLSSPSSYTWQIQDNVFDLNKTCLSQSEAYLCIDIAGKSSNDVSGEVEINHLPLVFVEPLLPEELLLEGEVSGNVTFKLLDNNWALRAGTGWC